MLVMMPGCSPGSNQAGAIETCTAQVIWPSGAPDARGAGDATRSASAISTTDGRTQVAYRMASSLTKIAPIRSRPPHSVNRLSATARAAGAERKVCDPLCFIADEKCTSLWRMGESLKLGIAGLGTVGTGLIQLLEEHGSRLAQSVGRPIVVAGVSARTRGKKRGIVLEKLKWFDEPERLAADPSIDVFVELIGGEEGTPKRAVEAALGAGKPVVTANKALLARHGTELAKLAEKNGVALNFEAAVAGGIPVIKTLREALAANQIRRVYGILNGTCNYILTQ